MGGAVGGLAFIGLLVLAIILLRRDAARRSGRQGDGNNDIPGAELEKTPMNVKATYVAPRKPVMEQSGPSDSQTASNVPVADIVELVYQRLQEERPPYEEATTTTTLPSPVPSSDRFSSPRNTRPLPIPATSGLPPYAPQDRDDAAGADTAVFRKS